MIIYSLGKILGEISYEDFVEKKKENDNVESTADSYLFICNCEEAKETLQLAEIGVEGGVDLSAIEFCKVESLQECLFGTLRIPRLSDICGSNYKIQFLVNERNIVIVDDSSFSSKITLRIIISKTKQGQTRERFLYNFLTNILSRDLEVLNRYEHRIMSLEEEVTGNLFEKYTRDEYELRKQLLILREYYDEMSDLGKQLEENENKMFLRKNLKYFGILSDRADRLMNRTMYLIEYMMQIRDFYNQKISDKQNNNMKFLTVLSTIFLPLTLITGWFGMNFENMPELKNGYPYVWFLSIGIVMGIVIFLKKRKII